MARKPRIHVPGALYHVILRGNNGQSIFGDDADRYKLQELIEEGTRRFGYHLLGYCWMGNHIHAAVRVGAAPLSLSMHNLSFRYTGYYNWRHKRVGHLFQGRYRAILVDSDSYLLRLVRYIHMNPVRAGIVPDPRAWPWCSHRAYLGDDGTPAWLDTAVVLRQFNTRKDRARAAYRRFMGMPEQMLAPLDFKRGNQKSAVLGDELFAHRMAKKAECASVRECYPTCAIVTAVCNAAGMTMSALCASRRQQSVHARAAAAYLVTACGDGNLAELARHLGRDPSTLSRAAQRYHASRDDQHDAQPVAARAQTILRNASMHA